MKWLIGRSRLWWIQLITLLLPILCWLAAAPYLMEKTDRLTEENHRLRQEYEWRSRIVRNPERYVQKTTEYRECFDQIRRKYPDNLDTEAQLFYYIDLEKRFRLELSSMKCGEAEELYSCLVDGENWLLLRNQTELAFEADEQSWRSFVRYIEEDNRAHTWKEMSVTFDNNQRKVNCRAVLDQYAVARKKKRRE